MPVFYRNWKMGGNSSQESPKSHKALLIHRFMLSETYVGFLIHRTVRKLICVTLSDYISNNLLNNH